MSSNREEPLRTIFTGVVTRRDQSGQSFFAAAFQQAGRQYNLKFYLSEAQVRQLLLGEVVQKQPPMLSEDQLLTAFAALKRARRQGPPAPAPDLER